MDPAVDDAVHQAIGVMRDAGAIVEECSLPLTSYALAVYYIIAPSECSTNLARYDGVKYGFSVDDASTAWETQERTRSQGFGPEVKRRIMLGTYALSAGYYDAYYLKALKVRTLIRREFEEAFERFEWVGHANLSHCGLSHRRENGRPRRHVQERCADATGEHRGHPVHFHPLRLL